MNKVGDIDGKEGYLSVDIFGKIKVTDIVLINSPVVAALANEGYAATVFEAKSDFEEVDAGLHLVSFTALGTEVGHIVMIMTLLFFCSKGIGLS